ncbi:MAG: DUF4131 domain-containing protein, partial [Alphaproteobacteria bacterium]
MRAERRPVHLRLLACAQAHRRPVQRLPGRFLAPRSIARDRQTASPPERPMRCAILAFLAGTCWLQTRAELPTPGTQAGALAMALALFALRRRLDILLAAALLGAAWAAWLAHGALADALPREMEGKDVAIDGTVDSLPHEFEGGTRFNVRVERVLTPGASVPR